jgi:hypothetical protein
MTCRFRAPGPADPSAGGTSGSRSGAKALHHRHGRACPGHLRQFGAATDSRHKAGHFEKATPLGQNENGCGGTPALVARRGLR